MSVPGAHVTLDMRCDRCGLPVGEIRMPLSDRENATVILGAGGLALGAVLNDQRASHVCPGGLVK